jgi:hypothetical protein
MTTGYRAATAGWVSVSAKSLPLKATSVIETKMVVHGRRRVRAVVFADDRRSFTHASGAERPYGPEWRECAEVDTGFLKGRIPNRTTQIVRIFPRC